MFYSKFCEYIIYFCYDLIYHQVYFKYDLFIIYIFIIFLNKTDGQMQCLKVNKYLYFGRGSTVVGV